MVNQNNGSKKTQLFCFFYCEEKLAGLERADSVYSPGRYHIFCSQIVWYLQTSVKGQNIFSRNLWTKKTLISIE